MRKILWFALLIASLPAAADTLYDPVIYQPLVSDRRAYRAGDVLTVMIVENSSASASAGTATAKSGGFGATLKTPSLDKNANAGLTEDFSGKGTIQRAGKLLGTITVTVQSVDVYGNLLVKGDQLITINGDKQEIKLEGRVRSTDIQDNNTIQSTRVADARITYVGKGVLGDTQHQGLLSRIFTLLGLL
jgi:flagellar L-ring protein precursor FlgH